MLGWIAIADTENVVLTRKEAPYIGHVNGSGLPSFVYLIVAPIVGEVAEFKELMQH